jgi:diguanylate cyclase (GGDEF)-like protein
MVLQMDFAQVEGEFHPAEAELLEFRPYQAGTRLRFGGTGHGVVLRVPLPETIPLSRPVNLVIQPRYFTRIEGWFRYRNQNPEGKQWKKELVGRLMPTVAGYYSTKDLLFELDDAVLHSRAPIYLYVQDMGDRKSLVVSLASRQSYLNSDVSFSRYIAMLYGMIFVLALINLIFYFFIRETPFLLYSIYMLSALISMFWQEGWITKIISLQDEQLAQLGLAVFAPLSVLFFYQFYRSYLGIRLASLEGKLLLGFQIAYGAVIVARVVDGFFFAGELFNFWSQIANGLLIVGALGLFVLTLTYWVKGYRLAGYLFTANTILIAATLMRIYYAFNITAGGFWLAHVFEVALALDAIILSLALADRTLSIKRERDKARVELERVDTAYKREQLLAEFVRDSQALVAGSNSEGFLQELDQLLFHSIKRILNIKGGVLLIRKGEKVWQRSFGEGMKLSRLVSRITDERRTGLLDACGRGEIDMGDLEQYPDRQGKYRYLMVPIRIREHMDYCMLLVIPHEQSLDRDLIYGLREFVEKAVHACMDAENMEQLQRSARYDDLTGVFNRASMEMHISHMLEQCANGGRGLALAFVDLDHFKGLNDSLGHDFGDECLKRLCRSMKELLPQEAVIGRFGGDEFLVLLPGVDYFQATEVLARLNPALQASPGREGVSLSVSVGIAECLSGKHMAMAELLKKADISLYAAKAAGRGCIGARAAAD